MINRFAHKGILEKKSTTFKNYILFYNCTNQIHVLFVITLVIYVITWENKQSKLCSKRTWISTVFPFLQLLCSINLSCRSKNITQTLKKKKHPDLPQALERFLKQEILMFWNLGGESEAHLTSLLLLPSFFFFFSFYEKGSRRFIFEAC